MIVILIYNPWNIFTHVQIISLHVNTGIHICSCGNSLSTGWVSFLHTVYWPPVTHFKLLENRKRFPAFFHSKVIILGHHLEWCGILHEWNHCRFNFHFVNHQSSELNLHLKNTWCNHISSLDQDMAFSAVNSSFQPSWP